MPAGVRCPGCEAIVPDLPELRTDHLYVGAAPGCWATYTELIGRQMADPGLFESRMLSVDVYMAQHPGVPGRQSSQSVWGHLIGLYLVFERGYDGIASARAKARVATPEATFEWLEPPSGPAPTQRWTAGTAADRRRPTGPMGRMAGPNGRGIGRRWPASCRPSAPPLEAAGGIVRGRMRPNRHHVGSRTEVRCPRRLRPFSGAPSSP